MAIYRFKMKIFPAIDLKNGQCVRLNKGDYQQIKTYSDDPLSVAQEWVNQGTKNLHIIDLDGAKSGKPVNFDHISNIKETFPNLYIQVGGGIRNIDDINLYLNIGIDRLILGTKIIDDLNFLSTLDKQIKERIIVDIAIKNGNLATEGWKKSTAYDSKKFINNLKQHNISEVVFTDVSKDGMLAGINFSAIENIVKSNDISVIASGGISSIDDIKKLDTLTKYGLSGAVIGKALYEQKINLNETINLFNN
tara:strand:+ start:386 stop:1135 length:750 start_codon:yes stop_codon:yes gene_type:complete